jgi:hypothetical protein
MDIFNTRTKARLQETIRQKDAVSAELGRAAANNEELTRLRHELEAQNTRLGEVQELLVDDILALKTSAAQYVGNDYRDYEATVKAVSEKYSGTSEWGCLQTGTIIDLRAAFILGDGVKIVHRTETKEEAKNELQWAKDFFEFNALDAEMAQELAKEAEIEGKIALQLFWEPDGYKGYPGMVSVRFLSWLSKRYTVEVDPKDYMWYRRLKWAAGANWAEGDVPEEEFVFKKFGGRIYDVKDARPKIAKCLTQIDRLDKALRDLREINHIFASPTPDFECAEAQQVTTTLQRIKDQNWRIGKAFAHTGKFSMVSADASGAESLLREIETNTKMISGTTGVPIHYLGYLDLLKNRATGDNTRELVMAATTRERAIWIGALKEMLEKAMAMFNTQSGAGQKTTRLDPEKVGIEIPLISQDHWKNLELVLIPAALGGIVSKEYVAGQIPGVDEEEEADRRQKAEVSELAAAKEEMGRMRLESANKGAVE